MISMKSTYVKCLSFVTCVMKYVQCPLNLFYFRIMFDYNNFSIIKLRKKASRYYDHTHIGNTDNPGEAEEFYDEMEQIIQNIINRDFLEITGDFDERVGKQYADLEVRNYAKGKK